MTRFRSTFRFALPLAVLLTTTALTLTPANADWEQGWQSSNGEVQLWYWEDDNGSATKWVVYIEHDGWFGVYHSPEVVNWVILYKKGSSDPQPDPDSNAKIDKPDLKELMKLAKDAIAIEKKIPEQSPLAGIIEKDGGGYVPHWNPSDDDHHGPKDPP